MRSTRALRQQRDPTTTSRRPSTPTPNRSPRSESPSRTTWSPLPPPRPGRRPPETAWVVPMPCAARSVPPRPPLPRSRRRTTASRQPRRPQGSSHRPSSARQPASALGHAPGASAPPEDALSRAEPRTATSTGRGRVSPHCHTLGTRPATTTSPVNEQD